MQLFFSALSFAVKEEQTVSSGGDFALFLFFSFPCSPLLLPAASPELLEPCPSCLQAQVQPDTSLGWLLVISGASYKCFFVFFWFAVIIFVIFWPVGLHETLALLTSQLHPDANHKGDLVFLQDVFSEKSLSYIMKVEEIS